VRILITGATGFVGGWLGQELTRAYPAAELFGTAHRPGRWDDLPQRMHVRAVDLTDATVLAAFVADARPDHVFHLAGYASGAGTDRATINQINVEGTAGLLGVLADAGRPCRVLLASSGYVYGATLPGRPAREEDPLAPSGPYAESKAAMEAAARSFAEVSTLSITITRSFNHTGPRQGTGQSIPKFAQQIARVERGLQSVVRHGNLGARRDFLDVRDVARAYRLLICEAEPVPWRVVNVCSGNAVSIREALDQLVGMARGPVTLEEDPELMRRPSDLPECVGDPSALIALTGWQPEIPFTDTLAETLDWWREVTARKESG
jgi:GDP-4-dehydro-6-deoxy-D-mannose reductase